MKDYDAQFWKNEYERLRRIKMCHQCRRRRESNCTNRECMKECEWMVKEKTRKGEMDEQLKLF